LFGCSDSGESAESTAPEPLDDACPVVEAAEVIIAHEEAVFAALEEAGYSFTQGDDSPSQGRIFRAWRSEHSEDLEALRDDVVPVVVDARGLVAKGNPYGVSLLRYVENRLEFYVALVDAEFDEVVRRYSQDEAEYEEVLGRCEVDRAVSTTTEALAAPGDTALPVLRA